MLNLLKNKTVMMKVASCALSAATLAFTFAKEILEDKQQKAYIQRTVEEEVKKQLNPEVEENAE